MRHKHEWRRYLLFGGSKVFTNNKRRLYQAYYVGYECRCGAQGYAACHGAQGYAV